MEVFDAPRLIQGAIQLFAMTALLALQIACDNLPDEVKQLQQPQSVVIVLAAHPLTISNAPVRFDSSLRVVGKVSRVCLSLRGNLASGPAHKATAEFISLLGGAKVTAVATRADGRTLALSSLSETWSRHGRVEKSNELSACMHVPIGDTEIPIGTSISRIELSSDKSLAVRGVYWESTNAWDGSLRP